jgi:cysteine desulfurase/selenocysteine lyase
MAVGETLNPAVRADFPQLRRLLDGKPIVYLDSAATALKPQCVIDAEVDYLTQRTANIHRGKHALSEEASHLFEAARRKTAGFLNAAPDEIVFLKNTTEALNLVASGLGLTKSDRVLCATGEHHSNLVPWLRAASVITLEGDPAQPLDPAVVVDALERHRPKVLALGHASNLTGVIHPIETLTRLARERGVITVVDAAQSAPHFRLDVEALGADALAFSAHKVLGPTGVGVLWARPQLLERLEPLAVGGGVVDRVTSNGYTLKRVPFRFEAGTPNISGVLGLGAALEYLQQLGFEAIEEHERALALVLEQRLSKLAGATLYMAQGPRRLALATLVPNSNQVSPDHLAVALSDSFQIMVRSGFHCAHPAFDYWKVDGGSLRISAYLYNTVDEIHRVADALEELLGRLVLGGRQPRG